MTDRKRTKVARNPSKLPDPTWQALEDITRRWLRDGDSTQLDPRKTRAVVEALAPDASARDKRALHEAIERGWKAFQDADATNPLFAGI
jgi:hypothetical protein